MARQQIEFIIKPDGTVTEQVSGVEGPRCEDITRMIEERLGEVTKRDHKPEFWQQSVEQTGFGEQSASVGGGPGGPGGPGSGDGQ
jgi:hypothetical protein